MARRFADGLGMIEHILTALAGFIVHVISATGYLGIVLMMAIESACIPLPSEVIMPFAGYLVSQGVFTLVGAATAAAIGENIGAFIAYEAGKRGGRPLVERYGHYLLIDAHHPLSGAVPAPGAADRQASDSALACAATCPRRESCNAHSEPDRAPARTTNPSPLIAPR